MSLAEQLSQLSPLMTKAEMDDLLGSAETSRAVDGFSDFNRTTGVYVHFDDGAIEALTFTAYFDSPRDVAVCGLRIGMSVDAMRAALPELSLRDGATGEPDERGFISYQAYPGVLKARL